MGTVGELLGLRKPATDRLALGEAIREGLPASALERVKQSLDLPDTALTLALGISTKTLGRLRRSHRPLSLLEGDRLYRIAEIIVLARSVLEDDTRAREWLRRPQMGLNNQRPLDVLVTEAGAREVEDLLLRIEHGVLP